MPASEATKKAAGIAGLAGGMAGGIVVGLVVLIITLIKKASRRWHPLRATKGDLSWIGWRIEQTVEDLLTGIDEP